MTEIQIVGGGIIGLYTALVLSRSGLAPKITIVAKHLPGDSSIEYTSPIAGAHWGAAISTKDLRGFEYSCRAFPLLERLFQDFGLNAGLERLPNIELFDKLPSPETLHLLEHSVPGLEIIQDKEYLAGKGAVFGVKYLGFNFYTVKFLRYLRAHLESLGVTFIRRSLGHIDEAFELDGAHPPSIVFNCTGVTATRMGGVEDSAPTYPIRGQTVEVRAPHVRMTMSLNVSGHQPTYVIPRPNSGGRVILGGYSDEGDWSAETYATQTASILDRATRMYPELLKYGPLEQLEVIAERTGLRPGRKDGVRIEREQRHKGLVIHNYGAGGMGYQAGLAMAVEAVELWRQNTSFPAPRL